MGTPRDRLWRGGAASPQAAAVGLLAGPFLLTLSVWVLAVSLGMQDDYDGPRVVMYLVKQVALFSALGSALYGLPAYLFLARRDRAGLFPLTLAGAGAGFVALLALGALGAPLSAPLLLGVAAVASCGGFAAAVFWFAVRKLDRS